MSYIDSIIDGHYETMMDLENKLKNAKNFRERTIARRKIEKEKRKFDEWNERMKEEES